jgi:DNA-directed RNA polymerase subunit N (RpoN/RPB10)
MLYFRCPSCKTLLANKQLIFEEKMIEICDNMQYDENQKNKIKKQILDDLELHRPCCRMRIMSYVKLIEIIK